MHLRTAAALALLATITVAQSEDRAPIAPFELQPTATSSPQTLLALGDRFVGPLDVDTTVLANPAPGAAWNRELGCAYGWGYFWVSGGAGSSGAFAIHQFATDGTYIQSFPQFLPTATAWGMRDLAVDETAHKLWGGMESRWLNEYDFMPPSGAAPNGVLVYNTSYQIPIGGTFTSTATVRALAHIPGTDEFWVKNFSSALWRISIAGGIPAYVSEFAANGKAAYGLALDPNNGMLWSFDQGNYGVTTPSNGDGVECNQIDPTTGALTGTKFDGVWYGVAGTNIAGGADIYFDACAGKWGLLTLHQNTVDELNVYELDRITVAAPVNYCTAGTTTNGCNATMTSSGVPSRTATSGFVLTCGSVEGQKTGLLFYGINGRKSSAWGTGTSFLCVKAPTQRTGAQNSGGTTNGCDGAIALDFLSWVDSHPNGVGVPFCAGDVVDVQCWFRDPPAPKTTNLSDGLEFTLAP